MSERQALALALIVMAGLLAFMYSIDFTNPPSHPTGG